jgi:hypothetical protein
MLFIRSWEQFLVLLFIVACLWLVTFIFSMTSKDALGIIVGGFIGSSVTLIWMIPARLAVSGFDLSTIEWKLFRMGYKPDATHSRKKVDGRLFVPKWPRPLVWSQNRITSQLKEDMTEIAGPWGAMRHLRRLLKRDGGRSQ